jgi:hypothetical protein
VAKKEHALRPPYLEGQSLEHASVQLGKVPLLAPVVDPEMDVVDWSLRLVCLSRVLPKLDREDDNRTAAPLQSLWGSSKVVESIPRRAPSNSETPLASLVSGPWLRAVICVHSSLRLVKRAKLACESTAVTTEPSFLLGPWMQEAIKATIGTRR